MDKNIATEDSIMDMLNQKFDLLLKKTDDLYFLQKLHSLEPKNVLEFLYRDIEVKLCIPNAESDFIQKHILRRNTFYEFDLLQKLERFNYINENSVVYDVGANIGNHTVFFSKVLLAKRVVSFEPQKHCFKLLEKNIDLNRLQNTAAINSLVGEKDGAGKIETYRGGNLGATSFSSTDEGGFSMVSLDKFAERAGESRIDFLKVDVEGMQVPLFEGARQILGDMKPILWVELLSHKNEFEKSAALLNDFGYKPQKLGKNDYLFLPE